MQCVRSISGTTPGSASTAVVGSAVDFSVLIEDVESLDVIAALQGATGGTLDLYLQSSPDGTTWTDMVHFAQLAAGAAAVKSNCVLARAGQQTAIQTVGQNLSPALAAAATVGGSPGPQFRLVAVAGAGTTLGIAITITLIATGRQKV